MQSLKSANATVNSVSNTMRILVTNRHKKQEAVEQVNIL
jgi:hypothetical protein